MRTSLAHQDLQYAICNCKVHRIQLNTASAGGKDVPRPLQSAPPCLTSPEVLGKPLLWTIVDCPTLSHLPLAGYLTYWVEVSSAHESPRYPVPCRSASAVAMYLQRMPCPSCEDASCIAVTLGRQQGNACPESVGREEGPTHISRPEPGSHQRPIIIPLEHTRLPLPTYLSLGILPYCVPTA